MEKEWIPLTLVDTIKKNDAIRSALNPNSDSYVDYKVVAVDGHDIVLKNEDGIRRVPIVDLPIMHLYYQSL